MKKAYDRALAAYANLVQAQSPQEEARFQAELALHAKEVAKVLPPRRAAKTYVPYPEPGDNAALLSKVEFARFRQGDAPATCSRTDFELTNPQHFLRNLVSPLTPYNGVLIYHGVGVGKTCAAVQIAEGFRSVYVKKALVIGPTNLVQAFKQQVYDPSRGAAQCTGRTYAKYLATTSGQHVADASYDFMGYQKFANLMQAAKREFADDDTGAFKFQRYLRREFSDRVIIIDEVHNLRKVQNMNKGVSRAMETVLTVAENTKLVLMTATPLYHDVEELRFLMELLFLNDKDFERAGRARGARLALPLPAQEEQLLKDFSARYVSHVRGDNPATFPARLWPRGARLSGLPTRTQDGKMIPREERMRLFPIFLSRMSEDQLSYMRAPLAGTGAKRRARTGHAGGVGHVGQVSDGGEVDVLDVTGTSGSGRGSTNAADKVSVGTVATVASVSSVGTAATKYTSPLGADVSLGAAAPDEDREEDEAGQPGEGATDNGSALSQLCTMVYPNESGPRHGRAGFEACFVPVRYGSSVSFKYRSGVQFLRGATLASCSPKIAAIVELAKSATGVVLVYSRYVYASLLPLALALEHAGFTNASSNLLYPDGQRDRLPHKYAMLVAEHSAVGAASDVKARASLVQLARQPRNVDGGVIKVVLLSGVAAEGTDFRYVRELHVMEPWHNMSRIEQVIGRGVRNCSHALLPERLRNCTVYLHAADRGDGVESPDIRMYRLAELKQLRISQLERIIKTHAVDCSLNRALHPVSTVPMVDAQGRKVLARVGDADFTRACDFGRCDLACAAKAGGKLDVSTDDVYFMNLEPYQRAIKDVFTSEVSATFEQLRARVSKAVPAYEERVFFHALNEMMLSKAQVVHGKDQEPGHVIYAADRYLFQPFAVSNRRLTLRQRAERHAKVTRIAGARLPNAAESTSVDLKEATDSFAREVARVKSLHPEISQEHAQDYALDHAHESAYRVLGAAALRGQAPDVLASLRRMNAVFEGVLHVPGSGIYVDANNEPLPQYRAKQLLARHVKEVPVRMEGRKGVISYKDAQPVFKMIYAREKAADKITGIACERFPQLKLAELVAMTKKLAPTWQPADKKASACEQYELALRVAGGGALLRPVPAALGAPRK